MAKPVGKTSKKLSTEGLNSELFDVTVFGAPVPPTQRVNRRAVKRDPKKKTTRIDTDEYFLKIAMVVAERSTCLRHHIGAVAVKDKHILATGYNGAASGRKDCFELGCLRNALHIPSGEKHEICRAIHAEQNVIIQASLHGTSLEGSTIYCTHTPCRICAKMLVNSKIKRFITYGEYSDNSYADLFKDEHLFQDADIEVVTKKKPSSTITYLD